MLKIAVVDDERPARSELVYLIRQCCPEVEIADADSSERLMELLEEKDLQHKFVCEFECYALMSEHHPLAGKDIVDYSELKEYIELVHGDFAVPMLSPARARQLSHMEEKKREIAIYERGSQLELLSGLHTTYMWGSPLPQRTLTRMALVQKRCNIAPRAYRDILVYRKGLRFSPEEESFIGILVRTADNLPKD